jgi:hypothetical protein
VNLDLNLDFGWGFCYGHGLIIISGSGIKLSWIEGGMIGH